ncbi:MAG: hypothetical protein BM485_09220 [Desulfobulbaceae bacterium DB1]|nr:MAG: hypothetical protein BM485_09220 [Desulfobulbaceae bacterium DB1]
MKNEKKMIKLFGGFLLMTGVLALGAGNVSAGNDMAAMMDEGIAYADSATAQKVIITRADTRASMAGVMAEGIAYPDSVIADDAVVAKIDHRLATLESMENCLCEDGSASVDSMIASSREKALDVMPAAGTTK